MTPFDKAIVAAIMAVIGVVNIAAGRDVFGPDIQQYVTAIVTVLTPAFVYLVPNAKS